jgi:Glycosyl transferase family 2
MPGTPRISVVIATYNWGAALRPTLQSALAQTEGDFELLVIGDGCTDDSADVVASFADERVHWHNLPANFGCQSGPNNEGVARARAPLVAYLGQDDLWHPEHLQTLADVLERSAADLAYSVALLYGPPGSGLRSLTGLVPAELGQPLRFVPPSSIAHRRDLLESIGPWSDPRGLTVPLDYDFLRRAWANRHRFEMTGRLTTFKLPASWRADAYRLRCADEQAELLRRMSGERDFTERELIGALAAQVHGRFVTVDLIPEDERREERGAQTRVFKGLAPALPASLRSERLRFDFDQLLPGFEWHGPQRHETHGIYQWTGPGTRSSLHLPLTNDRDLALSFCVMYALAPDVIESLRVSVNDEPVPLTRESEPDGAWVFRAILPAQALARSEGAPRLTFEVNRVVVPARVDRTSTDERALGVAISWLEIGPVPEASPA